MLFKSLGQYIFSFFFFKEINNFIQEGCVKLLKNIDKYFYFEQMLLFLTLYSLKKQRKN